jgi:hypothetical protein
VVGLTVEAAALLAVTLAAGAVATRFTGHGRGGVAAGPALLAFVLITQGFGRYWPLFLSGSDDPGWAAAHIRWALILAAATIVLAVCSLDPARRSKIQHRRRTPHRYVAAPRAARVTLGGKP